MDLSIIVPCYNETQGLANLASRLGEFELAFKGDYELVLVDDGSKDNTFDLIKTTFCDTPRRKVKAIKHDKNKGIGGAVRTGLENASSEYVATMDSDCTYRPVHLTEMLDIIKKEGADIITASPYHPKGRVEGVPPNRLVLSKGLSVIYSVLLRQRIYTYTSMFRIYRVSMLDKVRFNSDGFLSQAEVLIKALKRGYKVIEYPATLSRRQYGVSSAKVAKVIKEHLRFIWRLVFDSKSV
ncbi:MAG: glycosyltransferase family 2 protein [Candidatus Omnitrophica bacterium]|nr:glycosyltransferase family 2 protein [Candidatus Omnitrophota bacterium]MDD4013508.1 glycosyltransferase family 2 protein [Candidatus Omnitrophota bacterium]